jgi:serine phosphatase RsbU (regulator of sigma subunit)
MPLTVLLSVAANDTKIEDLRAALVGAGFAIRPHTLGSAPGVEFGPIEAVVIEVGEKPDVAAMQTRRWRAELGDELVPIVWVLPAANTDLARAGLDAGADVVLSRPLDPDLLVAQIRAASRLRAAATRVATRAREAKLLGEQLNRALTQHTRELNAARRIGLALLPRAFPEIGTVRFSVCHRQRSRTGGDFYGVQAIDSERIIFHLGDVLSLGGVGSLLAQLAAETLSLAAGEGRTPDELLARVNDELLRLGLEDEPLVALLVGTLNANTGEVVIARAGLPAPVHISASGEVTTWAIPGPFLGISETSYPVHTAVLHPGEKLLLGSDGTHADGQPGPTDNTRLAEAVSRHHNLTGQAFVDAVGRDLLGEVRHNDDFTLLCVSRGGVVSE